MKIRTRLGLTYLAVSLLVLMFISTFYYFHTKKVLASEVLNHLDSVSSIQGHRIDSIFEQNLERIRLVSSRTQLRISLEKFLVSKSPGHNRKMSLIIKDALGSIGSFSVISVLDKTGNVIASTRASRVGLDYSEHEFFPVALQKNSAEHFFIDAGGELKLYLSGPLMMKGKVIGVLLIESNTENIVSLLSDYSGLGQTGETILGRVAADGESAEYLTPTRFDQAAALQRRVSLAEQSAPLVMAVNKQQQLLTAVKDYRGQYVLAATYYISRPGWGLVVKIDESEAFESISQLLKYIVAITLGVIFIVIFVSYVFASYISKPIVELTRAAYEINKGDLSQRAIVKSDDEVGELAGTFNSMANNLILTQYDLEDTNKELQEHRNHLERLVSVRTRELQEINKELESFSYSVSHDLRSPLRAVDGYSQMLMEDYAGVLDDEAIRKFTLIRHASSHMGNLIDDLLNLSRINRSEIVHTKVDLSAKVKAAISTITITDEQRDVEFVVQAGVCVNADSALMDVVVANLIGNAWKYTSRTENAMIEFGQTNKYGEPVCYIRDNGIGFDMKYSDKLFGAFQRLVKQDEYPGTGIGLATVKRVIDRHGGQIWVESEPGKGTTFYFSVEQS